MKDYNIVLARLKSQLTAKDKEIKEHYVRKEELREVILKLTKTKIKYRGDIIGRNLIRTQLLSELDLKGEKE